MEQQQSSFIAQHKTKILIGSVALLTMGIGWYLYKRHQEKKKQIALTHLQQSIATAIPKPTSSFRCQIKDYPLRYGVCHNDVRILQQYLQRQGGDLGRAGIDGKFGRKTKAAAKRHLAKTQFTQEEIKMYQKQITA